MNIIDFAKQKKSGKKISMITCYDYTNARILSHTAVDCLLVGDSVAMTMHGFKNTLSATVEMMCMHTAAVARGAGDKFIISDLPFLSYKQSLDNSMTAVLSLMQAGAHALKLEGAEGNLELIRHLTDAGIPVMGHLGLTLQMIHGLGGFKVQGKTKASAERIKADALRLQEAGCFAVVLECMPSDLAETITHSLSVPTIGIGAGSATDGQVLVLQDLLGFNIDFKPKFVKAFMKGHECMTQSIESYINAIQSGDFPTHEHCYENSGLASA
jgi:3-methyl-2-oxobutanoate hydroxymethyltransferase